MGHIFGDRDSEVNRVYFTWLIYPFFILSHLRFIFALELPKEEKLNKKEKKETD